MVKMRVMTMRSLTRLLFYESIQHIRRCYSFMRCRCPEFRTAANSLAGSRYLQRCLKLVTQTCCPPVVGDRLITFVSRLRQDFLKPKIYCALGDIRAESQRPASTDEDVLYVSHALSNPRA